MAIAMILLLAYQAITALRQGNPVMGENYLGQPVGPGLQLAVCAVALVAGIILAWQSLHGKPKQEKNKGKDKSVYFRWPHDNIP